MTCPHCAHELAEGQSTCPSCGFVLLGSSPTDAWSAGVLQARQRKASSGRRVGYLQNGINKSNEQTISSSPGSQDQLYEPRSPLRATRFTTNPLLQNEPQEQRIMQAPLEFVPLASNSIEAPATKTDAMLLPDTLLGEGRYRLTGQRSYQKWSSNAYEIHWHARDLLQGMKSVLICEMGLLDIKIVDRQTCLRTAMRTLSSIGPQAQVPALTNVFREGGRDFFVFTALEGESLLQRLQRTGQRLHEQEVSECCLQVVEALEVIARQNSPIVHGRINPENIQYLSNGRWSLTNFSVVLASGAYRYFRDIDPSVFSPFTPPDFAETGIDPRLDLYSLLATAYYAVTGEFPKGANGGPLRGQQLHAFVSPSLGSILTKGLRPLVNQRYQHPSELRQSLLPLRPITNTSISANEDARNGVTIQEVTPLAPVVSLAPETIDPVARIFSSLHFSDEGETAEKDLLPRPEELPPFPQRNDALAATLWMVGLLICLLIPIILK